VSLTSRILGGLAVFLLVAGTVYGLTSHEDAGTTMLLVAAVTFAFLSLVSRSIAKREAGGDAEPEGEVEVLPTIWPLVFSLSAVLLMLGVIVTAWFFAVGGIVFLLAAAGWVRDVTRARAHTEG
jgi:drug/metabolite transporter (DMT)-like permease